MTTAEQVERFERYRDLWDALCVLGGRMREASASGRHAEREQLEAEYGAVLGRIRAAQGAGG